MASKKSNFLATNSSLLPMLYRMRRRKESSMF